MRIRIARAWVCDSVTAGALGALAAGFFAGSACAYAVPAPVSTATDAHTTRLRMTGQWSRPLSELADDITRAAEALSDTSPGVIVFHCTANSMAEGQAGEARILELVEKASGCQALTTGLAVKEALA